MSIFGMEFHWWYLPVGLVLLFVLFGKKKGGFVVTRVTANMEVLDQRFAVCQTDASYSTFKVGSPDHIDIEVERLPIQAGEELEFHLNGNILATVKVKRNKEAEFDHWSDEDVYFPVIKQDDELVVRYQGIEVLKGVFESDHK